MSYGYPRLRPDSSDYQSAFAYSTELQQNGAQLSVLHQLANAQCLPAQWLQSRDAMLTCEVRAPYMLYCHRYDHVLPDQKSLMEGEICLQQDLNIPETHDQRIYFIPAIVLRTEQTIALDSPRHGVSALWHGKTVTFPKGAVLAGGHIFEEVESVTHLLEFQLGDDEPDVVRSFAQADDERWRFVVKVHTEKMAALEGDQHTDWRNAFYVGCLAQMLNAIREDFRQHAPPYEALRVLAAMIQDLTGKSPPWETETGSDEWGDTLYIATHLHKLHTPGQGNE